MVDQFHFPSYNSYHFAPSINDLTRGVCKQYQSAIAGVQTTYHMIKYWTLERIEYYILVCAVGTVLYQFLLFLSTGLWQMVRCLKVWGTWHLLVFTLFGHWFNPFCQRPISMKTQLPRTWTCPWWRCPIAAQPLHLFGSEGFDGYDFLHSSHMKK